jgi:hypothetical protein
VEKAEGGTGEVGGWLKRGRVGFVRPDATSLFSLSMSCMCD